MTILIFIISFIGGLGLVVLLMVLLQKFNKKVDKILFTEEERKMRNRDLVKCAQNTKVGKWKCPECGSLNEGKFCNECGFEKKDKKEQKKDKFCTNCGTKLESGLKFCENCGEKVEY